ncbi:hypothetical protein C8R43DRAFT_1233300 [Mycena crocata]|nr:hypothetical protein C8R43DRAFT_1233300 [Mycena crocata]
MVRTENILSCARRSIRAIIMFLLRGFDSVSARSRCWARITAGSNVLASFWRYSRHPRLVIYSLMRNHKNSCQPPRWAFSSRGVSHFLQDASCFLRSSSPSLKASKPQSLQYLSILDHSTFTSTPPPNTSTAHLDHQILITMPYMPYHIIGSTLARPAPSKWAVLCAAAKPLASAHAPTPAERDEQLLEAMGDLSLRERRWVRRGEGKSSKSKSKSGGSGGKNGGSGSKTNSNGVKSSGVSNNGVKTNDGGSVSNNGVKTSGGLSNATNTSAKPFPHLGNLQKTKPVDSWTALCARAPSSASPYAPTQQEREGHLIQSMAALSLTTEWCSWCTEEDDDIRAEDNDVEMEDVEAVPKSADTHTADSAETAPAPTIRKRLFRRVQPKPKPARFMEELWTSDGKLLDFDAAKRRSEERAAAREAAVESQSASCSTDSPSCEVKIAESDSGHKTATSNPILENEIAPKPASPPVTPLPTPTPEPTVVCVPPPAPEDNSGLIAKLVGAGLVIGFWALNFGL